MPNKYLDSVGLAEYTTLIKTALDDKADLASPALTGTPTAPTPTAGDNSTKVATTAFVNTKAGNYLLLTGGSITGNLSVSGTITGNVTGTASGNLPLSGGTVNGDLTLYNTGTNTRLFIGYSTTDKFTVGVVGSGTDAGVGLLSKQGSFSDSLLILKNGTNSTNPSFQLTAGDGTTAFSLIGKPNGDLKWAGKEIERVDSSGSNYIRYVSGLQICWGSNSNIGTGGTVITFPVSFVDSNSLCYVSGSAGTALTYNQRTTTSFKVYATSNSQTLTWLAVGKWK